MDGALCCARIVAGRTRATGSARKAASHAAAPHIRRVNRRSSPIGKIRTIFLFPRWKSSLAEPLDYADEPAPHDRIHAAVCSFCRMRSTPAAFPSPCCICPKTNYLLLLTNDAERHVVLIHSGKHRPRKKVSVVRDHKSQAENI